MGVPGIDLAVSHKILHHKRPGLCPLLDRVTEGAYPPGQAWAGIHKELTHQTGEFTQLEGWFEGLAASHDGVALQRLRLHDILLWLCRSGELDEARRLGRNVL